MMAKIRDRKTLGVWLQGKPESATRVIAVRTALRVLPLIDLQSDTHNLSGNSFRAIFISWVAVLWPHHDFTVCARSAARIATRSAKYAGIAGHAAAADAAGAAVNAVELKVGSTIAAAVRATDEAAYAGLISSQAADIWSKLEAEINFIDAKIEKQDYEPANTLNEKLNIISIAINDMQARWKALSSKLLSKNEYWQVWIEWYERRLSGKMLGWDVDPAKHEALCVGIALESDEFWKRPQAEVNANIAARVETARLALPLEDNPASTTEALPALPQQGHGPHYRLNSGKIVFAPQSALDANLNDINRLRSLLPVLKMLCRQVSKVFGQNQEHGDISDIVADYGRLLDSPVEAIDYAQLAGFGLILGHLEAAANRQIEDRLRSEFEDKEKAVLKSLLDAHGPFILATEVGRDLLADAEQYQRNAEQEHIYRQDGAALVKAADQDGIVRADTADFTRAIVEDVGKGPAPERTAVFGRSTIRNFTITVIGGGAIGACALMGKELWDVGQPFFSLLAGGLGLTSVEALKKSKPFQETVGSLASLIDKAGGFDGDEAAKYKAFAVLILKEEERLRRLAGTQREYAWLHDWLDWIKANYKA